nr:hypothetical protein [uncultured Methanolobus sp.]
MVTGKQISYATIVYFWVIIGILNADLPLIFGDYAMYIPLVSIGWLWRDNQQGDESDDYHRRKSPQILTERGTFSWDGTTYYETIGGEKYAIHFGNGCNYDGLVYRGNVAIVCPAEHVCEVGRDRFIGTHFNKRTIPFDLMFPPGTKTALFGNTISPFFIDDIDKKREMKSAEDDFWMSMANTYHSGYNRIANFLNSHSDLYGMNRKLEDIDKVVREIEQRSKISFPDKSPAFYQEADTGRNTR